MTRELTARPPSPSVDNVQWLVDEADELLRSIAAAREPLLSQLTRLRAAHSPERAHLLVEQVELRRRARVKFAQAERMFFTPLALEQATDEIVAAYKATRFAPGQSVFDLCCGIGGDLLALANRGRTTGVDSNPIVAVIARANGRLIATPPTILECDVTTLDLGECDAWHIDPDRRPHGRRTTQVELHEPDATAMARMLQQNPNAAIKLAPAAEFPAAWAEQAELEWISRDGECRQLVAWFGSLTPDAGNRRATVLSKTPTPEYTLVGAAQEIPPATQRIARYVYEPDAAVLAAGLTGAVAAAHRLAPITHGIAYLTSDERHETPALAGFEVCDVLPFDLKKLKSALRERRVGRLEIKKRGIDEDIERLRRQLDLRGEEATTLLLARVAGRVTAILARRLEKTTPAPA